MCIQGFLKLTTSKLSLEIPLVAHVSSIQFKAKAFVLKLIICAVFTFVKGLAVFLDHKKLKLLVKWQLLSFNLKLIFDVISLHIEFAKV